MTGDVEATVGDLLDGFKLGSLDSTLSILLIVDVMIASSL